MDDAWEQAFALMAGHGQLAACQIVAAGLHNTPPGQVDQFRRWEAIADCLNAVADAQRTQH